MKISGIWKKRISIWLILVMIAGNYVSAVSPMVYAETAVIDGADYEMSQTNSMTSAAQVSMDEAAEHLHQWEKQTRVYLMDEKCDEYTYVCSICGEEMKEKVPHTEHVPGEAEEKYDKELDCMVTEIRCTECLEVIEKTPSGHRHTFEYSMEYDAESNMDIEKYICMECGELQGTPLVKEHVHRYTEETLQTGENQCVIRTFCTACGWIMLEKKLDGDAYCEKNGQTFENNFLKNGSLDMASFESETISMNSRIEVDASAGEWRFYTFKVEEQQRIIISPIDNVSIDVYKEEKEGIGEAEDIESCVFLCENCDWYHYYDDIFEPGIYHLKIRNWNNEPYELGLFNNEICQKDHLYIVTSRYYDPDPDTDQARDLVDYYCLFCEDSYKAYDNHIHKYECSLENSAYDSDLNQEILSMHCFCGDVKTEVNQHNHYDWEKFIITSYDGENVEWKDYCTLCNYTIDTGFDKHHLYCRWGEPVVDSDGLLKMDGCYGCTDPDCTVWLLGKLDLEDFTYEPLSWNQPVKRNYAGGSIFDADFVDLYSFEMTQAGKASFIVEYTNRDDVYVGPVTLYRIEKDHVISLGEIWGPVLEESEWITRLGSMNLEAGSYIAKIRMDNEADSSMYSLCLANEEYCKTYNHYYQNKNNLQFCSICGAIEGTSESRYGTFDTSRAIDLPVNKKVRVDMVKGHNTIGRFILDHSSDIIFSTRDWHFSPYWSSWSAKLFMETEDGRLLLVDKSCLNLHRMLPAGTYYIKYHINDDECYGYFNTVICTDRYCEQTREFYREYREYDPSRGDDLVLNICEICGEAESFYAEHTHLNLRWKTIGVNTENALIEDYYDCMDCEGEVKKVLADIKESASCAVLNEEFNIEVGTRNWKVLFFDVEEAGEYLFRGRSISYGDQNCYVTVYEENEDGTLTQKVGNGSEDTYNGFQFRKQLEEGRYYVVVRCDQDHDEQDPDEIERWRTLQMLIARRGEYCEKNGHSGPILEILDMDPENDRVTVCRKCDYCEAEYEASEYHTLVYGSAQIVTGSAILGDEAMVEYYCTDCGLLAPMRQPLTEIAEDVSVNCEMHIQSKEGAPNYRGTRFFRFEVKEEQDLTLYTDFFSLDPASDTKLYQMAGDRFISVSRIRVPANSIYAQIFKASLKPGIYYYSVSSLNTEEYDLFICNKAYCSEYGHQYFVTDTNAGKGGFCIFCNEPLKSEDSMAEMPEAAAAADEIELNQILELPVEGECDKWVKFTLNHAQKVVAAGATEDNLRITAELFAATEGKLTVITENVKDNEHFMRTPAYLEAGTYYIHITAVNESIGESGSIRVGVFEISFCSKNGHFYTLSNIWRRENNSYRYVYKCSICGDQYDVFRDAHECRWGAQYWKLSSDGNVNLVSNCTVCRNKSIWSSQLMDETESLELAVNEMNEVVLQGDLFSHLSFTIESENTYSFTLQGDGQQQINYTICKVNEDKSVNIIRDSGFWYTESTDMFLTPGRYDIIAANSNISDGSIQMKLTITEGESYCDRFGHEMSSYKYIVDFDPKTGYTLVRSYCEICDERENLEENHTYFEDDDHSRIITVSGSAINGAKGCLMRVGYACADCGISSYYSKRIAGEKQDELGMNSTDVYRTVEQDESLLIPFSILENGFYRIELPEQASFDVYRHSGSIHPWYDRDYYEALRGLSGLAEIGLNSGNYMLRVYFEGEKPESVEVGIYKRDQMTEILTLKKENSVLTAVYTGSKEVVSQGIAVYAGEIKGNITLDTAPRTRIAFTESDNGSFSLDISSLPSDMTYRAYVEFKDGTFEYSNIL